MPIKNKIQDLRFFYFPLLLLLVASFFTGCRSLEYTPGQTPEEFSAKRHEAIANYIKNDPIAKGKTYQSIAFSPTQIIKPASYKALDSLYELKYQNELKGLIDKRLEDDIAQQRMIALNDTNKVLYIENHIFELENGDTSEVYSAAFQLNSDLEVTNTDLTSINYIPKNLLDRYQQYLFGESFLYPGEMASYKEKQFYNYFRTKLESLPDFMQNDFMLHMLDMMVIADKINSTKNSDLIEAVVSDHFLHNYYGDYNEQFDNISETYDENDSFTGYEMNYSYDDPEKSGVRHHYHIKMDPYFQLTDSSTIP